MAFLKVRLGRFERHTTGNANGVRRAVSIIQCAIIQGVDFQIDGQTIYDKQLDFWIWEFRPDEELWKDDPEKIGAFDTSNFRVNLNLLPQAFSEVWAAAIATTGAERFIRFDFKENHPGILAVTEASLSEFMSSPIVHPVVAELHIMRDTLKGAVLALTATALLVLVVSIVVSFFRAAA